MQDCGSAGDVFGHLMVHTMSSISIKCLARFNIRLHLLKFTITYLAETVMHDVAPMLSSFRGVAYYMDNGNKFCVCASNGTHV